MTIKETDTFPIPPATLKKVVSTLHKASHSLSSHNPEEYVPALRNLITVCSSALVERTKELERRKAERKRAAERARSIMSEMQKEAEHRMKWERKLNNRIRNLNLEEIDISLL